MKKLKSTKTKSTLSDLLFIAGFLFFLYSVSVYDFSFKKEPPMKSEVVVNNEFA
jgi:hypothetical protein